MTDFHRDWQIVMPHLGPRDNLEGFLASAGDLSNLPFLLVDNSPDSHTRGMNIPVETIYAPDNFGTSMSWNLGICRGKQNTLILSVSTRFPSGGLEGYLERARHWVNDYGYYSPIGGHCHVIGRQMVREVGLFDPNLYPAYAEDTDFGYRTNLSNIVLDGSMPIFHPPGLSIRGSAIAVQNNPQLNQRISEREAYFFQKWGGPQCKEVFKTPFGNPANHIAYFPMPDWFKGRGLPEWDWYTRW